MNLAAVSFLVQIDTGAESEVADKLESLHLRHEDVPEGSGIHFLSVVILPADLLNGDDTVWLSIEASIDALEEEAATELCRVDVFRETLTQVASAVGTVLQDEEAVVRWLRAHQVPFQTRLGAPQGLAFNGTPGMSASRIRMEARLADWVRSKLSAAGAAESPLQQLHKIRSEAFQDPAWKSALFSEPTQLLEPGRPMRAIAAKVLWAAARDYLWFLMLPPALAVFFCIFLPPMMGSECLGSIQALPLLLAATTMLVASVFVDRIRLIHLRASWLLLAVPAVGVAVLALRQEASLATAILPPEKWQAIWWVVAITGFVFGTISVLLSRLQLRVRLSVVAVLLVFAAVPYWPGWSSLLPSGSVWPGLILETLGLGILLVPNVLLLAAALQTTAARLQTKTRLALLVGLSVVVVHLAINPNAVADAFRIFAWVLLFELLVLAVAAAVGYRRLRDQEEGDRPVDREPDNAAMRSILNHENQAKVVQNHLAAQSIAKPGCHRKVLLRVALWVAGQITAARSPAGFLGRIGTIHHARWLLIPNTRRLVFLSNYDGSWESYLEDFIARLREGLSSLWSNTEGFPRTFRLTTGGASDGSRFKRWARRQQVPSRVWVSGYPKLTTIAIRTNAEIRLGLAAARTEHEAHRWLVKLGVATHAQLERNKIPSLVFGGMSTLGDAAVLVLRFGQRDDAQSLIQRFQKYVPHGPLKDSRKRALTIGLTLGGLTKLGMEVDDETYRLLPSAFVQGMADPNRARMLGDFYGHESDPGFPTTRPWGRSQTPGEGDDAIILVHADAPGKLARMLLLVESLAVKSLGHTVTWKQLLEPPYKPAGPPWYPPATPPSVANVLDARDGISQPIIRGLKGSREPQRSIHVVEPGEMVIGYRDNLSNRIPEPAGGGVNNLKNGTFLVVRQLQFDRAGFDNFLAEKATQMLPPGADAAAVLTQQQWIAGKMLGRWPSGASLVREPDADPDSQKPDNDFLYGQEDPAGVRCPLGSHARRMNPRDSLDPGSRTPLAVTNRHRILRVGRRYRRANTEGLMFMCLNADIERQFEFLQQTWALGASFRGLNREVDPLLGPGEPDQGFSIPGESGTVRLVGLPRFVELIGGGYFFLPGKDYLERLSGSKQAQEAAAPSSDPS